MANTIYILADGSRWWWRFSPSKHLLPREAVCAMSWVFDVDVYLSQSVNKTICTADKKQISDLVTVNPIIFRLVLHHSCRKFKNTLKKIIFLTPVGTICWNIDPVENTRPSVLQESSKPQSIIWHWLRPFNRRAKLYEKHFGSSWQDWMQVIQSMSYEER